MYNYTSCYICQDDETSIKRDMTVGSFNYMAPEAIVDTRHRGFKHNGKPSAKVSASF